MSFQENACRRLIKANFSMFNKIASDVVDDCGRCKLLICENIYEESKKNPNIEIKTVKDKKWSYIANKDVDYAIIGNATLCSFIGAPKHEIDFVMPLIKEVLDIDGFKLNFDKLEYIKE